MQVLEARQDAEPDGLDRVQGLHAGTMDHELEVSVHGLEYEKQVLKGSLVGGSKNSVHLDDVWMTCTSQNPKLLHDHARVARRVKAFSHAFDGHLSASVKIRRQPDFSVGAPTDAAMNSVALRL